MRVLITGAGGFLGKHLARRLLDEGHEVWSFSRSHYSFLKEWGVTQVKGSLDEYDQISFAVSQADVVFHVASLTGMWGTWDDFYKTNVQGTSNVIKACLEHGVQKLIYTSTPSVVFGKDNLENVDETCAYPSAFLTHYARSKAMAEKEVLEVGKNSKLKTLALRPHLIWGAGEPHMIPRLVDKANKGKLKIVGNGKNLVDVIHVENAVEAHIKAWKALEERASEVSGQAFFIAQEKPVELWWFINELLKTKKAKLVSSKIPVNLAYFLGCIFDFVFQFYPRFEPPMTRFVALQLGKSHYFSQKKAENLLQYRPLFTVEDGLERLKNTI